MVSVFHFQELADLLEDFYRITRIRITVFDHRFREVISYPEDRPRLCRLIRSCDRGRRACAGCDAEACAYAARQKTTHIYRCHAGLTEAIMPLHVGEVLVGYLLFGHVFSFESREEGEQLVTACCRDYPLDPGLLHGFLEEMPLISPAYIRSAARVLQMTAAYLAMERMATVRADSAGDALDAYLNRHYTDPLTAQQLCAALNIGRSKLFKLSRERYGCGIQQQIRKLRMEKARRLLLTRRELGIKEIAAECGYGDYNYFISVFSGVHGKPPHQFRTEGP